MNKKQGAVIGIGGIGVWHGQMMRDTGKIEVRAVCDANPAMREKAKEKFPEAVFYSSHDEMFSREKLDLVGVITPHNLHAPIAIAALTAGASVVVEKPMATRYEDCVAMIAAARKSHRSLTVFHNRRLDGWFLSASSVLDAGYLGDLIELNSAINYRPGPETWRGYKEQSGGILFDWGAHLVDYVLHFARSEVKAVSGFYYRAAKADPALVEDHGSLRIYFESGAVANVAISGADMSAPLRYRLVGTRGTLTDEWNWDEKAKLKVLTRLAGGEQVTMEVSYRNVPAQRFYDNVAVHLCDGAPLMVSAESAAKVINVLCTAERSHAKGGIPLPLA